MPQTVAIAAAHQVVIGAIQEGGPALRVDMPDHLGRLFRQSPVQLTLPCQLRGSIRDARFQAGVEIADLGEQPAVLDGDRRQLREFQRDILVALREVALVLVRQLQPADVGAVAARQRHRQQAAQWRMNLRPSRQFTPARMGFQFALRQPQGLARLEHQRCQTASVGLPARSGARFVFRGKRERVEPLSRVLTPGSGSPWPGQRRSPGAPRWRPPAAPLPATRGR